MSQHEYGEEQKGDILNILVSDRSFVKLEDGKETDINPDDFKIGDIFNLYTDKTKEKLCHWGKFDTFKYYGDFMNEEGVLFITCEIVS